MKLLAPARVVVVLLLLIACGLRAAERLPAAGAIAGTTASGISSGGYMAVQFHVAHSSVVKGVGVLAAGPYYCAQGSAWAARYNCMNPGTWTPLPAVGALTAATEALAQAGLLDPTEQLRDARVWLFSGLSDHTVRPGVTQALQRYYLAYVPADRVVLKQDLDAGHAMITADHGGVCAATAAPFINDCDFDAAGALLAHLLGPLATPAGQPAGVLMQFDQREFAAVSPYAIGMDETGFLYFPQACRAGGCRIHVAFHGCRQGRETIGDAYSRHAGYNRWADSNRIIVLYPQAIARYGWGPWPWPSSYVFNPNGCWDWWGYSGTDYHTKRAPQIRAVKAMLDRLAEPVRE
jgi:poly(3-hydroxybutyrate) depolymerase